MSPADSSKRQLKLPSGARRGIGQEFGKLGGGVGVFREGLRLGELSTVSVAEEDAVFELLLADGLAAAFPLEDSPSDPSALFSRRQRLSVLLMEAIAQQRRRAPGPLTAT